MILSQTVAAWGQPDFPAVFSAEVQGLGANALPLQAGLAHSSQVSGDTFSVMVLETSATTTHLHIRAGIFYAGVIVGSCCADDPTPLCEQPEYCELLFTLERSTAATHVTLLM